MPQNILPLKQFISLTIIYYSVKAFVLEKVLELTHPLLKDSTMLANVNRSKDVVSTAGERYQESLVCF
jgi:hypothetical protein